MKLQKLDAQKVCDLLNDNIKVDGFTCSIRHRIPVSMDIVILTDVSCSELETGFDSSALGFINMLVDEPIAMATSEETGEPVELSEGVMFIPLSKTTIEGK
jgi:hypothetical protein